MEDDQYEQDHAAQYQADDDAMEVLRAVADSMGHAKHLVIVGPFDDERVCDVQFTDAEDAEGAPKEPIRVSLRGQERQIEIRTSLRSPPVFFSDVSTAASIDDPPDPPTGRSMGGDAIWHVNPNEHGTAALFAGTLKVSATPPSGGGALKFNHAVLSCRHVLAGLQDTGDQGDSVSMVLRPDGLTIQHKMTGLLDVAVASVATPADYHYCRIRALGTIAGVRRPRRHMRVYKYGARTGLTSGRVGSVKVWKLGPLRLKVAEVSGRFACVHDSGAAVVDDERRLVGLVFKGSTSACTLNTVTYVMAAAPFTSTNANETLYIDYKEPVE